MRKATLLICLLAAGLAGCGPERWEARILPGGPLTQPKAVGVFPTLEQCRAQARSAVATETEGKGSYECRKNCKTDPRNTTIQVCAEVAT